MKFENFQAPVLFSSTFKALNLGEKKFQVPSRMRGNPVNSSVQLHSAGISCQSVYCT